MHDKSIHKCVHDIHPLLPAKLGLSLYGDCRPSCREYVAILFRQYRAILCYLFQFSNMNIRSRLIVLVLSVLLPAFAAGGIAVAFIYGEERSAQERALSEAARVLAQLVDNELESSEYFLRALSASPDLAEGKLERFYRQAKLLSNGGKNTIILSGLDGMQILNTRLPWGAMPRTINPRLLQLRRARGMQGAIVSDLFFSPLGKRYDFAIQLPVEVDGAVRYYLSRGVEAAQMQRFLNKQGFPANWIASVVDREGVVIARSKNSDDYVGKSATGDLASKIRAGLDRGTNDGYTLEGTRVKAFFHRAPKSEWTVVLSVPSTELEAPAKHAAWLLTTLIAIIFIGALTLTRRYLIKILGPIRRLQDDARLLGRGEPVARFASGLAELDMVNSALVQASVALRGARSDMERRVAEAIESTERAQRALLRSQKLEALGRLTGGVAHDFNNVLQTLTSALQLIGLESNPHKIPDRLAVCRKAIERATVLISRLRSFGQTHDAYFQVVAIGESVNAVLPMLRNALPASIQLDIEVGSALELVRIDITQFELALLNLVMNARDAIREAGTITIRVTEQVEDGSQGSVPAGRYVRIDVADTGMGMPPEIMAKALEPFFTTKAQNNGTGLGLPQAYAFALQSRGTLLLSSEVGIGSLVTLLLPVMGPGGNENPALTILAPATPSVELHGVILFVDDDPLVRESVVPILEQHGATVHCASSAQEALLVLADGRPVDIVLSDIVMPGEINGIMLARHLRQHYPSIPIILATGYFDGKIDLPNIKVLAKPYQMSDLLTALSEAHAGALPAKPARAP